ncbi:hypothetical protein Tco_0714516 [Tanacetum coccineum]
MTTLAENVIFAGADNRPPMLDKSMYNSWKSRMILYIRGKEHGLPPDVYSLVNHHDVAKDILDRVRLLIMTMQQVQVNTKFLNSLQPEWSNFVTDVNLARNMHTTNYDQLYAYLSQHEVHVNEVRKMRERFLEPLALYQAPISHLTPVITQNAYQAPAIQQLQADFPQLDSGLVVPAFLPRDDLIASLNKAKVHVS